MDRPADIVSAVQKYCNTGARRDCGPHRAELTSSAYLRTDESHKTDSAIARSWGMDRRDLGSAKLHPFQFMPIFPLVGFPLKWKWKAISFAPLNSSLKEESGPLIYDVRAVRGCLNSRKVLVSSSSDWKYHTIFYPFLPGVEMNTHQLRAEMIMFEDLTWTICTAFALRHLQQERAFCPGKRKGALISRSALFVARLTLHWPHNRLNELLGRVGMSLLLTELQLAKPFQWCWYSSQGEGPKIEHFTLSTKLYVH